MVGILGILTAISFGIAILNYFVKYINKHYISKLGKEKATLVNNYRKFMRIIVKNHKLAGTIAVICMITHIVIALLQRRVRIAGIIAVVIMLAIFILGLYGVKTKNYKGKWLSIHRFLAFSAIVAIIIHVITA